MDDHLDLFCCRNCIQNPVQGIYAGHGQGFCLHHDSVIRHPEFTTCRYLHRKDLPLFLVDEGMREHAAEFAGVSWMVDLRTQEQLPRVPYSELFCWEKRAFSPILHAIAQYHRMSLAGRDGDESEGAGMKWRFMTAFAGSCDGRHGLAHASLVRRYMNKCGSWTSSYRHILGLVQDMDATPSFASEALVADEVGGGDAEARDDALWEVVFCRFSGIQEYGWHAGIRGLLDLLQGLDGMLADFDWENLRSTLRARKTEWTSTIIDHAKQNNAFFGQTPPSE
jgi:hypothetical protein